MIKDKLQVEQPVVYQAIRHVVENNRIASAYLFTGPYGTPKYEAAIFLAQCIFCEKKNGLACETCNTCRRVREGKYADLIVLDGRDNTISKDMVDELQSQFAKTALEENGQRVYIIRNIENATVAAQNSMLKFLEEPESGITAILTTDAVNRILPTILSRCTQIPFLPMDAEYYLEQIHQAGVEGEDAYFLSHLVKDMDDLTKFYDGETTVVYQHAKKMFQQFLDLNDTSREELAVDFEYSWSSKEKDTKKAKKENLILLTAFFDLLILYCRDVLQKRETGISWYDACIKEQKDDTYYTRVLEIAVEQREQCNRFNDLYLVMYQMLFRLEDLKHV